MIISPSIIARGSYEVEPVYIAYSRLPTSHLHSTSDGNAKYTMRVCLKEAIHVVYFMISNIMRKIVRKITTRNPVHNCFMVRGFSMHQEA